MDILRITTYSYGRFTPMLVTIIVAVFLLALRGRTKRSVLLALYFIGLTLFNLGFWFSFSVFHPAGAAGWYVVSMVLFGLVAKIQFSYLMPENRYPREARIVFYLSLAVSFAAFAEYVVQAGFLAEIRYDFQNHNYESAYYSRFIAVVGVLLFFWSLIVQARQVRAGTNDSGDRRTALGFLLLSVFEVLLASGHALQMVVYPFPDDVFVISANAAMLFMCFLYVLLYINVTTEPTSFIVKLTAISLVTLLALLSSSGLWNLLRAESMYEKDIRTRARAAAIVGTESFPEILSIRDIGPAAPGSALPAFSGPDVHPVAPDLAYIQEGDAIFQLLRVQARDRYYEARINYEHFRDYLNDVGLPQTLVDLAATLIILFLFPFFFSASVTGPLRDLLSRLNEVDMEGGTTRSEDGVSTDSFNEIERITRTFSRMMGILKDARERLRDYSDHLREVEVLAAAGDEPLLRPVGDRTLVCVSPVMHEVLQRLERMSAFEQPVLVTGETGTGKELAARLIHEGGPRAEHPFIAVNCAAIPASLWEDEVFGHVRGAFTDARGSRKGRVGESGRGSLFFDEIGEMPLDMQAKLLRLLQERQYRPIGAEKTEPALCRFIFATNRNLEAMVRNGEFREDLYYRINVLSVRLPALRERRPDIPAIVDFAMKRVAKDAGVSPLEIDERALAALVTYDWPGNIREVENVLTRSLVEHTGGTLFQRLPPAIRKARRRSGLLGSADGSPGFSADGRGNGSGNENGEDSRDSSRGNEYGPPIKGDFDERLKEYSKRLIQSALAETRGNKTKAAEMLGIKRNRLRYQIRELGLDD